jgi:hypothetical protein
MRCDECQLYFSAYYDGQPEVVNNIELVRHLKECTRCRKDYSDFESALRALKSEGFVRASAGFKDRVLERARTYTERTMLFELTDQRAPRPKPVLSLAAAFLLIIGASFLAGYMIRQRLIYDRELSQFDKGNVQVGPGKWIPKQELKMDLLEEEGLVKYEGKWMRPSEKEKLLQRTLILADKKDASKVAAAIDGVRIGEAIYYKDLTIYPLTQTKPPRAIPLVITWQDETVRKQVTIQEIGQLMNIMVENKAQRDIYFITGDLIPGGRCDRVVASDVIIQRGQSREVPVYCAEPERFEERNYFDQTKAPIISPRVRNNIYSTYGQGYIWYQVTQQRGTLRQQETSPVQFYNKLIHEREAKRYMQAFQDLPEQIDSLIGIAVAVRDRIECIELFTHPELLRQNYKRILGSIIIETLDTSSLPYVVTLANRVENVKGLLMKAARASHQPDLVQGSYTLITNGEIIGKGSDYHGEPFHLVLFPPQQVPAEALKYNVHPRKIHQIVEELKIEEVEQLLRVSDAQIRFKLVDTLCQRRDPSTLPVLLSQLEYGDEKVVQRALQEIPLLLEQHPEEPFYEEAILKLASTQRYKVQAREILLKITGQDFPELSKYRDWWNKNSRAFLKKVRQRAK